MYVTRKNFNEVLSTLPGVFEKAQFIAFDTEFTGLNVEGKESVNRYDTLESYYMKCKQKVDLFIVIQYGIVVFYYDEKTGSHTHQGYNFYIFPSSVNHNANFTCQASSLEFLARHGFDFNKVFSLGIPYLSCNEKKELLDNLEAACREDTNLQLCDPPIPSQHEGFIKELFNKIDGAVKNDTRLKIELTDKEKFQLRKLIFRILKDKYGAKVYIAIDEGNETISITCQTNEQLKKENQKKLTKGKEEILDHFGFSKVIKLIIKSGKLLVGHNLLLDLMFTIRQFIQPLPETYREFIDLAHFLFPKIADTRMMAAPDRSLQASIESFRNSGELVEVEIAENAEGFRLTSEKIHEAGFDAYLTGLSFLTLCNNWGKSNKVTNVYKSLLSIPIVAKNLNKLAIPNLLSIPYMDLEKYEEEADRSNVFHVKCPKEWQRGDMLKLFKNCGAITIAWISRVSAYVCVDKDVTNFVERHILNSSNSTYEVRTFNEHIKQLNNRNKENAESEPTENSTYSAVRKRMKVEDLGEVVENS